MKVLVIGSGGREHTIVWKLSQSEKVTKIWCAPGNAGISELAECIDIKATDIDGVCTFALKNNVDMVMVAPDDPLAMGMVDALEQAGVRAFGPRANAAILESSKVFSKNLMKKYGIPTAEYEVFDSAEKACEYIEQKGAPIVVKADGLALGKGVVVAKTVQEAKDAVKSMMEDKIFKDAGSRIVVEECISGPEVSVLAFTDGKAMCPMVSAQDHKRVFDNDMGPNTGGMGTFSPSKNYTDKIAEQCMQTIFLPTMHAMNKEGRPFKGVLYFGLMLTQNGPKVIEYNARFGDPETQVILPRLKTDLFEIFNAVIDERLSELHIEWDNNAAVCVVLASGGYPQSYQTGFEISGIDNALHICNNVFHAGTKMQDNKLVTAGGRVLGVVSVKETMQAAIENAYRAVECIEFEEKHYRRDIGKK